MSKYVDGEGDIPSVYVIRESILGILCPGLAFTLEKDTEKLKWAQKKAGRKKKWGLENVPYTEPPKKLNWFTQGWRLYHII